MEQQLQEEKEEEEEEEEGKEEEEEGKEEEAEPQRDLPAFQHKFISIYGTTVLLATFRPLSVPPLASTSSRSMN